MKRMGKIITYLAAALLCVLLSFQLRAANTMKLSTHIVVANQTFTVRVDINNSEVFAAFQLDVDVPAGFSYIQNSAVFDSSRINGQSLQAELVSGNKLRIVGYSPTNTLFVGDSGTIVRFQLRSATTPGTFQLAIEDPVIGDISGLNILTNAVNGSVLLQSPDINIAEASIDFDRTPLGQSTTRSITINNTGNLPLNITGVTFNSPYFEVIGNSIFTINGGQNYSLNIRFNSVIRGQYNKVMTIASSDPDEGSWNINLSARAYAVNELHTAAMFAYSGDQATLTYSINNMDPFTGFQFDLQLPSPLTYVAGSATLSGRKSNHIVSANIIPGNILRVIAYSANGEVFSGSSGNVLSLTFNVNGTGGDYPLILSNVIIGNTLSQNCLSDFYNGNLNVAAPYISSDNSLAFGDVSVLTFKELPFRIYNNGTDTLRIFSIQITSTAFTLLTAYPINLLPGQFTDLQVKFQQTNEGSYSGVMKMYTNDPVRPIYQVNLSGTAFSPNYMVIPDLICKNIDTLWVPVNVNNIEPFVGFQFDFEFPSFMQYLPGSGQLTTRSQNHALAVQSLTSTKIRVLAYSLTQSIFTGDTGAIVRLRFVVNSTDSNQTSAYLNLSNAILGNALIQNIIYQTTNGLLTIRYPHILSGTIVYNNAVSTPMDSVWLYMEQNGIKLDSVISNTSGAFSFANVYDGGYRITGTTNKPWGGVNGTDALKVQRHFAELELITVPIRLSGADVNNSGNINATDAIKIKRRFVELDLTFTKPDWLFESSTGSDSVVMGTTNTSVSFYALCTGDVNGSHSPGPGAKSEPEMKISTENTMTTSSNQQIYLPVMLDEEYDIGAISMILDFPGELAEIEEVTFVEGNPYFSASGGKLKIVWSEVNGLKINKHEPFAFIKLRTTSSFTENKVLRFINSSPLTELADKSGSIVHDVKIMIPSIAFNRDYPESDIKIYPNPAVNHSFLFFNAIEDGIATVRIFDIPGRCVETIGPVSAVQGLNLIDLDVSHLRRNTYLLSFELKSKNQNVKKVKSIIAGN